MKSTARALVRFVCSQLVTLLVLGGVQHTDVWHDASACRSRARLSPAV